LPLYEYQCAKCARLTEKIEKLSGPHLKKCPHCGGKVERMITAPAIQFKGSGWYVTDYAGKSNAKEAGKTESAGTETKENTGSKEPASRDSSPSDSKEKKPAKKK